MKFGKEDAVFNNIRLAPGQVWRKQVEPGHPEHFEDVVIVMLHLEAKMVAHFRPFVRRGLNDEVIVDGSVLACSFENFTKNFVPCGSIE